MGLNVLPRALEKFRNVFACITLKTRLNKLFETWVYILISPYPANVEKYVELLIMSADGRWDFTRSLKG